MEQVSRTKTPKVVVGKKAYAVLGHDATLVRHTKEDSAQRRTRRHQLFSSSCLASKTSGIITMRILSLLTSLALSVRYGDCFVVQGEHSSMQMRSSMCLHHVPSRRRQHQSERHASQLEDATDKLLAARMDNDQPSMDWSLVSVLFSVNVLLAWFLVSHGSPSIEPTPVPLGDDNAAIERLQQTPSYEEEDMTMWMDSSAGFFFY